MLTSCVAAGSPLKPTKPISATENSFNNSAIILGNARFDQYLPLLKNKRVGLVGNQSSLVGKTHLVDTLLAQNVQVTTLFSPEHGFRGTADAGATIKDGKDAKTGLPIISLYGANKKPTPEQLSNVDVLLFDIQDVGVRFYTYISTLHYVMEACAENHIPLIVLDKPNPNAHYVDGPILEPKWKSFIGMDPVPIVYGMTMGEYAKMINGEKWLKKGVQCELTVIPCENYTHNTPYHLPVHPSPNLRSSSAIYLYPSLCLFEGTSVSVGRGTETPFEIYGHPKFPKTGFSFTPKPNFGAAKPLWNGQLCNGFWPGKDSVAARNVHFTLKYLIQARDLLAKVHEPFITSENMFDKLAGTSSLREKLMAGASEAEIRKDWQEGLEKFKTIRNKYLIYK